MKRLRFLMFLLALPTYFSHAEQQCLESDSLATSPQSRFVSRPDGSIEDRHTNLIWRACLEGQHGEDCSGDALELNWADVLRYPGKINQGAQIQARWRLPNIRELTTLVELRCYAPAVNRSVFRGISANHVWTSSPYHFYTHYSWYVDFGSGAATYDERIRKKSLWLVRNNVN